MLRKASCSHSTSPASDDGGNSTRISALENRLNALENRQIQIGEWKHDVNQMLEKLHKHFSLK